MESDRHQLRSAHSADGAATASLTVARVTGVALGECKEPGIGTVVAQSRVPNKTALRKCFTGSYLRRAVRDERRGQDSNLRTSFPVTDLANPRFRPLSHLSKSLRRKDFDSSRQPGLSNPLTACANDVGLRRPPTLNSGGVRTPYFPCQRTSEGYHKSQPQQVPKPVSPSFNPPRFAAVTVDWQRRSNDA